MSICTPYRWALRNYANTKIHRPNTCKHKSHRILDHTSPTKTCETGCAFPPSPTYHFYRHPQLQRKCKLLPAELEKLSSSSSALPIPQYRLRLCPEHRNTHYLKEQQTTALHVLPSPSQLRRTPDWLQPNPLVPVPHL